MDSQIIDPAFFRPSLFESLLAVITCLLVVTLAVYTVFFSSAEVKQYFAYQEQRPSEVIQTITTVNDNVNQNKFAADAAIFIFWSSVGLVCYAGASTLKRAIQSAAEFEHTLEDSRLNKVVLWHDTWLRFLLRASGAGIVFVVATFVFTYGVEGLLRLIQTHTDNYAVLATVLAGTIVVVAIVTHIFTLALRLIRLRVRVFGSLQ